MFSIHTADNPGVWTDAARTLKAKEGKDKLRFSLVVHQFGAYRDVFAPSQTPPPPPPHPPMERGRGRPV